MHITLTPHIEQQSGNPGVEILELPRHACLALLATQEIGRLAVHLPHVEPPVIRPVNYLFDVATQSVVFRSGTGSKLHAAVTARDAAFEVDEFDRVNGTGWSVIIHGPVEQVTSPAEVARLRPSMPAPWAPGVKGFWVRIRTVTVSGRRIVLASDHAEGSAPANS